MPHRPRRTRRREDTFNPGRLNDVQCEYLLWGSLMFDDCKALGFPENDLSKHQILWASHRARIMEEWYADPSHAGRRPWAWWQFDHPGERQNPYLSEIVDLIRMHELEPWELPELAKRLESSRISVAIAAILRSYLKKEGVILASETDQVKASGSGAH